MPEERGGWEARVWAVLERLAPAIVVIGAIGMVVGIVSGQSIGLIAVDLMTAVVGAIIMLILRWRV